VNPPQLRHFLPTWLPQLEQKKEWSGKTSPHFGHCPFLRRIRTTLSLEKNLRCSIYIAAAKIPAPTKPANTSGKQSKTKIAIVLIRRSVPYHRKALFTVLPNLLARGVKLVVVIKEAIAMMKAIP
jgi:hypothetical protein